MSNEHAKDKETARRMRQQLARASGIRQVIPMTGETRSPDKARMQQQLQAQMRNRTKARAKVAPSPTDATLGQGTPAEASYRQYRDGSESVTAGMRGEEAPVVAQGQRTTGEEFAQTPPAMSGGETHASTDGYPSGDIGAPSHATVAPGTHVPTASSPMVAQGGSPAMRRQVAPQATGRRPVPGRPPAKRPASGGRMAQGEGIATYGDVAFSADLLGNGHGHEAYAGHEEPSAPMSGQVGEQRAMGQPRGRQPMGRPARPHGEEAFHPSHRQASPTRMPAPKPASQEQEPQGVSAQPRQDMAPQGRQYDDRQLALMEQRAESLPSRIIGNLLTFSLTLSMVLTPFAFLYVIKPALMGAVLDAPFQILAPIALVYVLVMVFLGMRLAAVFGCGPWYALTARPIELATD